MLLQKKSLQMSCLAPPLKGERGAKGSKRDKPSRKSKVDIGKILALKRAGWSHAKIADEMKLTVKQVTNYIYRYKNSGEEEK